MTTTAIRTKDETGQTYVYDAWNRLVQAGSTTYKLDALVRRMSMTLSGTTT